MVKPSGNDIEREIRFAVVIYGGVSLTIYINGIVQEMLHLVRSTANEAGELSPVELVYRELATMVGEPAHPSRPTGFAEAPGRSARKGWPCLRAQTQLGYP